LEDYPVNAARIPRPGHPAGSVNRDDADGSGFVPSLSAKLFFETAAAKTRCRIERYQ
jgi:hypothetical protein